jgi:SAM-dependent methyltransferase
MPDEPEVGAQHDAAYGSVTARYYDAVYQQIRRAAGDVEFYRELARAAGAPVLELGCGTGRVLLPIAELGIPCTGVDASQSMLDALAARNTLPTLRLARARMQDFDLGEDRFGLIFSAFRAFQHLVEVEDQLACLERVRRHLAPGGCFAFDVFAPRLERVAVTEEPETEDARFEYEGDEVVRLTSIRRDPSRQLSFLRMRYQRRRGGEVVADEVTEFSMRHFFRYELEHLLARAGFGEIEIFGAFDRRPYDYVSGEQVVVARH